MHPRDEILLCYPPTGWEDPGAILPLSVLMLVRPAERAGFRVSVVDARIDGAWHDRLRERIASGRVLVAGISTMTGPQIRGALGAAEVIRAADASVPIVWGGVHPSLVPDATLDHPLVDAIVQGEGDQALVGIAERLAAGAGFDDVPGVGTRGRGGEHVLVPEAPRTPLDDMELPAYDAVPLDRYRATLFGSPTRSLPMVTSRGCPYRCTYCYNRVFDRRRWRAMSPKRVAEVLVEMHRRHAASDVFLLDDEFFIDQRRVREIVEHVSALDRPFRFHNANCRVGEVLRFDLADLKALHRTGFRQIFVGVESGSDAVLSRMIKEHTVADVLEANRKLAQTELTPAYSFMAGLPFETIDQVRETLALMERLVRENPRARVLNLSIYSPFPGTPLFETVKDMGFEPPHDLEGWTRIEYDRTSFPGFGRSDARFLEDAHYFTAFVDGRTFRTMRATGRLAWLRAAFGASLRFRIRRGWYGFMLLMAVRRWWRTLALES